MMEKAMPKTSIIVKFRRSSCLYPSFAMMQHKSPSYHGFNAVRAYQERRHHCQSLSQVLRLMLAEAPPSTTEFSQALPWSMACGVK